MRNNKKKRTSKNKNKKIIIPYMNRALKNVRNFYEEQYKPFKEEECVYCPECFSIMLKSEKRLYKSFCCTGGKVTIPKVSETLPEEYKKLFTTPGPTRKCLKKNIITFNSLLSYCSTGFGKKFDPKSLPGESTKSHFVYQPNYTCEGQVNQGARRQQTK